MYRPGTVGPFPRRYDGVGDLSRRTGAGASHQVDGEVVLGKVFAVGSSRHSGHQLATGIVKGLAGAAVAVGGVPHVLHYWDTGAGLALLHQLQRTQIVGGVARQHIHAAVINWLSVSTTTAALCPSKRRLLLLWPWRIS